MVNAGGIRPSSDPGSIMRAWSGGNARGKLGMQSIQKRILYVINSSVFFVSHRLILAEAARAAGYEVAVACPMGGGVAAIRAAGFTWHEIPLDAGGMNFLRDLVTVRVLVRLFRTVQPDIVHNVTTKPVIYGTFAARLAGVPRVINAISGLGYLFSGGRRLTRWLGVTLYKLFMRHPEMRVILQNAEDVELFRRYGLAEEKAIRLIRGSGVDTDAFTPRPCPPGPPMVLQTSRMLGDKGVWEFIEAARILKPRWPEVRFVLAGPLYPDNPSALTANQLRNKERDGGMTWLGHVEDVAALLPQATVFCLASYREGLPKSLIEAGACGLPLITTDTSGCKEVVTNGINGLLVPVADGVALANAIEKLLRDPNMARGLGACARDRVVRDFSLKTILSQQIALYSEP